MEWVMLERTVFLKVDCTFFEAFKILNMSSLPPKEQKVYKNLCSKRIKGIKRFVGINAQMKKSVSKRKMIIQYAQKELI
jgi:hypothetical protein